MDTAVIQSGESKFIYQASNEEKEARQKFHNLFTQCPIPKEQLLNNLGLFARRQVISRIIMLNDLYKKIVDVHGIICEFGVQWGNTLALMESFRGMYEPYNFNRKIVGFDSFEGFPDIHENDGASQIIEKGAYATTPHYEDYLTAVLNYHESESPLSYMQKFELVKGDASVTIHQYLKNYPETIIAFAYFDFDLYEPTKNCLEAILPYLAKGAIIGFDELNCHRFPGETLAFKEVLGLNNYKIHRYPNSPAPSYIVFE